MSEIDDLIAIMPPPTAPKGTGTSEGWTMVEKVFGVQLPRDYKDMIDVYGAGSINNELWILSPFSDNSTMNLCRDHRMICDLFVSLVNIRIPYPLFPRQGGLLSWAFTSNGDRVYWETKTDSERWSIVVSDCALAEWQQLEHSCVSFILGVLDRSISVSAFCPEWFERPPVFKSV